MSPLRPEVFVAAVLLDGGSRLGSEAVQEIAEIDAELAAFAAEQGVTLDELNAWIDRQEDQ